MPLYTLCRIQTRGCGCSIADVTLPQRLHFSEPVKILLLVVDIVHVQGTVWSLHVMVIGGWSSNLMTRVLMHCCFVVIVHVLIGLGVILQVVISAIKTNSMQAPTWLGSFTFLLENSGVIDTHQL